MVQNLNRYCIKVAVLSLFLTLIIGFVHAQQTQDLRQRRVSISSQDTPLSQILTRLANLNGSNIVLGSDIIGSDEDKEKRVTIVLHDIPFEQALSNIVASVGLSYKYVGDNTYRVGTPENMRTQVGERSYLIPLNNVNAEKIAKSFESFGGSVSAIEGQNALMVYASPETYADIIARIQEMDVPQTLIEMQARIIEVSLNDTKKMGIDWSRINSLTTILAENPVNGNGVGLPYNYSDVDGRLPHGDLADFNKMPEQQYFQKLTGFDDVGHFSRQLSAFDVTLDWLLENNAAKLLANQKTTVINGETSDMFTGEVIPFVVMDNDKEVQVERENVGISLIVTPTINNDGQITAALSTEVSSVIDLVGGYVPRTKTRRLNNVVNIPNGQKMTAARLQNSNLVQTTNKLPFLGDIPFIGRLFQHQYTQVQNVDMIIEITARIVNIAEEQNEYEIDNRLGKELIKIKKDDKDDKDGKESK